MGSFSEISLAFDFAESAPAHVLAAFSALATRHELEGAPALPAPAVEAWPEWVPDWRLNMMGPDDHGDPYVHEPWRHDWASQVSLAMGPTASHGLLAWTGASWNLDCRFSWKVDPWGASEALAWLAPYVDPGLVQRKVLAGYALHEGAPRPHLFWVDNGRWELEDLNPNDDWW